MGPGRGSDQVWAGKSSTLHKTIKVQPGGSIFKPNAASPWLSWRVVKRCVCDVLPVGEIKLVSGQARDWFGVCTGSPLTA